MVGQNGVAKRNVANCYLSLLNCLLGLRLQLYLSFNLIAPQSKR